MKVKKLTIKTNPKIVNLLEKELVFADFALSSLNKELAFFERKFAMDWRTFLSKFEKGDLGDKRDLFKWYALAQFTLDWYDTKKEIEKTLRAS